MRPNLATKKNKKKKQTPLRAAILEDSALRAAVQKGLGALKTSDKGYIEESLKPAFVESIDIRYGVEAWK